MTDLIDKPVEIAKGVFDLGKGELKESTLYAGILGLGAASLIGSAFIMLPFEKLPYGTYVRMASLVLGGAALVGWSRKQSADMRAAGTMAGTVMAAAGVLKGAADFGLMRIPGASRVATAIEGGSTASFGSESEVMDDRNVIGQDGADFDTRPIAEPGDNVAAVGDQMDAGVAEMVGRFKPQESVPVDSVMETSTMAGTITQNFGADSISTGWQNPHHDMKMSEFVDATDALAQGKIGRAHVWNSSHTVISYAVFCLKKKNLVQTQFLVDSKHIATRSNLRSTAPTLNFSLSSYKVQPQNHKEISRQKT